jgi:hypothetical protein
MEWHAESRFGLLVSPTDRSDRTDRTEQVDRSDRTDRTDRTDQSEKKTGIGDRISECYDQYTAQLKKVRAFSCGSWLKKTFWTGFKMAWFL